MRTHKHSMTSRLPKNLLPWRRLVRALYWSLTGGIATLFLFGLGLVSSQFNLENHCQPYCSLHGWMNPISPLSEVYVDHIINNVLEPPTLEPQRPLSKEEVEATFIQDGIRGSFNRFLLSYIGDIENGTFVEVGSGDGQFLSFTSQLEVLLGWQGLMIEPREDAYKQARQRRRAAGANVCVGSTDFHAKETLWTPRADKDLPPLLQQATASRTVLKRYVPQEDLPDGDDWVHQCYRLEALVAAYRISANITDKPIDLLVIDANAGELEMFDMLVNPVYRVVALHLSSKSYGSLAEFLAGTMNMRMVDPLTISFSHIIFLHKDIDLVDKTVQNSSLYTKISK